MSNKQHAQQQQQTAVAKTQQNAVVRMQQRIAKAVATRQAHQQARVALRQAAQEQLANQQAFNMQVQQLAAQYGIAINPAGIAPRANSATAKPSAATVCINGTYYTPCKAVHALAALHGNRKATLAACAAHGINPATASTQWGVYKKQNNL